MKLDIKTSPIGAELTSIKLGEKEMLHQGDNVLDESGKAFWKRHAPILFPIVGSLKDNTAIIENEKYEMSQHGFARDMTFDILAISENKHEYVLKANEETLKKYPYNFELYISYIINESTLTVEHRVVNKDERLMYFGIGGHPAFCIDNKNNKYKVEFEKEEANIKFYQLEKGLISYKNDYINDSLLKDKKNILIKKDTFLHDAVIMNGITSQKVKLFENDEEKLEFNFSGFKYLALWSKVNAPFICIEPWYTTADYVDSNQDFSKKKDNLKLNVGEEFKCKYSITFKQ